MAFYVLMCSKETAHYLFGARCRLAYGPADATATHCLCFSKILVGFTFWYWLTWVVLDKGPLNGSV